MIDYALVHWIPSYCIFHQLAESKSAMELMTSLVYRLEQFDQIRAISSLLQRP